MLSELFIDVVRIRGRSRYWFISRQSRKPRLILCAEPFRERTPKQLPPDCHDQDFARSIGVISGLTDETAVSVTLNVFLS